MLQRWLWGQAHQQLQLKAKMEMHLDDPYFTNIFYGLRMFKRRFRLSLLTMRPVVEDIKQFLPATFELVLGAALLELVFGILLGVLSVAFNGKWQDIVFRLGAYLGIVTPSFVFAVLFILLFGYLWPVLPVIGRTSGTNLSRITGLVTVDSLITGNWGLFWNGIKHLIVPATALSMNGMALLARIMRTSMLDNLKKEYVSMEIAQGLDRKLILFKYVLKPSLIPCVSIMALHFSNLFTNAFLVELAFNWPGFSKYAVQVMLTKDLNAISAVVCVLGLIFIIVNIFDIIVSYLDPRIRLNVGRRDTNG